MGSMSGDPAACLNELVGERWPFLRDRIVSGGAPHAAISLNSRQCSVQLADAFARFQRAHAGEDTRGLASLWIQWYAVTTWPPLVAGVLALGRIPALDDPDTALLVDENGQPEGLHVPPHMHDLEPATALESLARRQARLLVDCVSAPARMAPRVAWSNVGNVLGWSLHEFGALLDDELLAPGHALLRRRHWPDGTSNPLFTDAACPPATGRPARRTCCLRYRLGGHGYCEDCPVPEDARRRATTGEW